MKQADSAHLATLLGSFGAWFLSNYDRLAAALCALIGVAYTVWKWRREIRKASREDHPLD